MSAPLEISARLLGSSLVAAPARRPWAVEAYANGSAETLPARAPEKAPIGAFSPGRSARRYPDGFGPYGARKRSQRDYSRAKAHGRKRSRGADGRLPNTFRAWFTEGERAVLSVVADEVKRRGRCAATVEKLAALAGVCIRVVQYALSKASGRYKEKGKPSFPVLLVVEERRRRRAPSLPNIVKIVSREWLNWLSHRPSEAPAVEAAEHGDWSVMDAFAGLLPRLPFLGGLRSRVGCRKVHGTENPSFFDVVEADVADGWQRLRRGLSLKSGHEGERAPPVRLVEETQRC